MKIQNNDIIDFEIPKFDCIVTERNFGQKVCEALETGIIKINHLINNLRITRKDFDDFFTWYDPSLKQYVYDKIELNKALREEVQLDSWFISENARLQELHYKIICSDNDRDILSNKPITNIQKVEVIMPEWDEE